MLGVNEPGWYTDIEPAQSAAKLLMLLGGECERETLYLYTDTRA